MEKKPENLEHELNDLKQELKNFQQEKERVRNIVGKIGGIPQFNTKLINIIFIIVILISIVVSVLSGEKWRLLMIELATVTLSVKIIYLIHCQMRVNHFKLWMLSSIEWRLNEIMKLIRQQEK
jgi:hypothetical protein